jgi:hypothetical protein
LQTAGVLARIAVRGPLARPAGLWPASTHRCTKKRFTIPITITITITITNAKQSFRG